MKLQIAKVIGFAGLLMSRAVAVTPPYANFTTASFNNITIATSTASSLHTIYTTAPNSSVANVSITLYNLNAYVDEKTLQAHYNFEFIIDPDTNAMLCNASVISPKGILEDVMKGNCWQNEAWSRKHNYTVPAHFSFAWLNTDLNTIVLVLRSTNPASANHCPSFPHDTCWAQGLYRVDPSSIVRYNGVQVYAGDSVVRLKGTYCKSNMADCALSRYIY